MNSELVFIGLLLLHEGAAVLLKGRVAATRGECSEAGNGSFNCISL